MLHAHLPYIRYPEHEHHLEEQWLYEAMTETYIPILHTLETLLNDNIDIRLTLSLTPTLTEMLGDDLLMRRYEEYLARLIELSDREILRTRNDSALNPLARMYHERFLKIRGLFENTYRKDLSAAFASLTRSNKVELITSAATHSYLPVLMTEPISAQAQIVLGADCFKKKFGSGPRGIWLPECGFVPGIDSLVTEAGMTFFFLEGHGLLSSIPRSRSHIYAPVKTPGGSVAFPRDVDSSKQVWSSVAGYPGDPDYRDFYRDIGFDLAYDYVRPYLPGGTRTFTGIKYHRITGRSAVKEPYSFERAMGRANIHAAHFLAEKNKQITVISEKLKIRPVITAAYDAELFGHWWFEGPAWLEFFFRKSASGKNAFRFVTPSEYLGEHPDLETVAPSPSSWGDRGYSATWIDGSNAWIYRHLNRAAKLMIKAACENPHGSGIMKRALNQAARELLLAQASDWAFMMKTGNASEFSHNKFKEHMANFSMLLTHATAGEINEAKLSLLERKNNLFRDIDYRMYCPE